mgnify:CR=1 FL=1
MFRLPVIALCTSALLLGGCASQNPYDQSAPSSNRTATYGGIGALAGAAALALRHFRLVRGTPGALLVMDAAAAFLLGAVVVGLMSAIGPAVLDRLSIFAATLGAAFIVGFAPQLVASLLASRSDPGAATAIGITAGNRNMALFLSVLPAATVDDVLLFVGCFQIPMYLTPFILARWYGRINAAAHRDRGA